MARRDARSVLPGAAVWLADGGSRMHRKDRTEATVAKDKKGNGKKDKGKRAARNGSVDAVIEGREPGAPEAWG